METLEIGREAEMSRVNSPFEAMEFGDAEFKDFVPAFEAAITNCQAKAVKPILGYRSGMRLCAAGRDLITWYFKEWQTDVTLETYASGLIDLFQLGLDALVTVRSGGAATEEEQRHLTKMINNTGLRVNICKVIAGNGDPEQKYNTVVSLYKQIADDRGLDLARA